MSTTTELIQGFGRTIKAIRQRENITQKSMAEGMGIGLTLLKRYEAENLEAIGPNGFSISIFSKLSEFSKILPQQLFEEILSRSPGLSEKSGDDDNLRDLIYGFSSEDLKFLISLSKEEYSPFGNKLHWILKMAVRLASLSDKKQAKIGVQILQESMEDGKATEEEILSQLQQLFGFTLQS